MAGFIPNIGPVAMQQQGLRERKKSSFVSIAFTVNQIWNEVRALTYFKDTPFERASQPQTRPFRAELSDGKSPEIRSLEESPSLEEGVLQKSFSLLRKEAKERIDPLGSNVSEFREWLKNRLSGLLERMTPIEMAEFSPLLFEKIQTLSQLKTECLDALKEIKREKWSQLIKEDTSGWSLIEGAIIMAKKRTCFFAQEIQQLAEEEPQEIVEVCKGEEAQYFLRKGALPQILHFLFTSQDVASINKGIALLRLLSLKEADLFLFLKIWVIPFLVWDDQDDAFSIFYDFLSLPKNRCGLCCIYCVLLMCKGELHRASLFIQKYEPCFLSLKDQYRETLQWLQRLPLRGEPMRDCFPKFEEESFLSYFHHMRVFILYLCYNDRAQEGFSLAQSLCTLESHPETTEMKSRCVKIAAYYFLAEETGL